MMKTILFLGYYNQFRDKIYTYFYYRVSFDRDTAEDLTAEVFLKAFEAFDTFDRERPFQPWIYRIAHNRLVNHYRDSKKHLSFDDIIETSDMADDGLALFEQQMAADQLLSFLEKLSPQEKYIITLKYLDELSYAEMAEIIGKSEGALRVAVNRAKKKLETLVQQTYQLA